MFNFPNTPEICDAGAWVHLKVNGRAAYLPGKDGEPDASKPIRIRIMGGDSPILQERHAKRLARAMKAEGDGVDMSRMSEAEVIARIKEAPEQRAEALADAVITWENVLGLDGKPVPFTPEAAKNLFANYPGIRRQVEAFAGEDNIEAFLDLAGRN